MSPNTGPLTPRELTLSACFLALCTLAFLAGPVTAFSHATFTTVDLLQNYSLFNVEPSYVARNQLLSDPVVEFLPWFHFTRSELADGRWPLWNPYNGCGAPFWANAQSAVLSPFSLPFHLFELKTALLAAGCSKVWLTGCFTYLFLRRLTMRPVAALFGALAFMFCGHNALLIAYPHSSVIVFLPAALFAFESGAQTALASWNAGKSAHLTRWNLALFASFVAMAYSGHPETLFFCASTVAAYAAVRIFAVSRSSTNPGVGWRRSARLAFEFVAVCTASIFVAAPLLLPFGEYALESSRAWDVAKVAPLPLDTTTWPRILFPDFLGTPIDGRNVAPSLPPPNYELANLGYVGGCVLLFAVIAWPSALRKSTTLPFALCAALWFPWAHDFGGMARFLAHLPGFAWIPIHVSQGPWALACAVLSALTLERILQVGNVRPRALGFGLIALAVAAVCVFWPAAMEWIERVAVATPIDSTILASARAHVVTMSATLLVGALAAAWIAHDSRGRWRAFALFGVFGALAIQNGSVLANYQVACEDRFVYPETEALQRLRHHVRGNRVLFLSHVGIPPHVNLLENVALVTNNDALGVRDYDRALQAMFDAQTNWRMTLSAEERALELFGVEFVAIDSPGLSAPATDESGRPRAHWRGAADALELVDDLGPMQLYRFSRSRVRVWLVPDAHVIEDDVRRAFAVANRPRFNAYDTVALGPGLPDGWRARDRAPETDHAPASNPKVSVIRELPGVWSMVVEQDTPHYLVLAQTWFPGWRATIDGARVDLLRANAVFTALDVPAGRHVIELEYAPRSWRLGLTLAVCGIVLITLRAFVALRGQRTPARTREDHDDRVNDR